jgi:hypothetical protein
VTVSLSWGIWMSAISDSVLIPCTVSPNSPDSVVRLDESGDPSTVASQLTAR